MERMLAFPSRVERLKIVAVARDLHSNFQLPDLIVEFNSQHQLPPYLPLPSSRQSRLPKRPVSISEAPSQP
jgi:hypothetical protein